MFDALIRKRRDGQVARKRIRHLLRKYKVEPVKIVTLKLRSRNAVRGESILNTIHNAAQIANNRSESSHELIRARERGRRKFKYVARGQRFSVLMQPCEIF